MTSRAARSRPDVSSATSASVSTTTPRAALTSSAPSAIAARKRGVDHPGRLRRHGDDDDHDVGVRQQLRQLRGRPDAVPGRARHVGQLDVEAGEHPADRRADVAGTHDEHPRADERGERRGRPPPGLLLADEERDAALRGQRRRDRPLGGRRRVRAARVAQHHPLRAAGRRTAPRPALSSCTSRSRGRRLEEAVVGDARAAAARHPDLRAAPPPRSAAPSAGSTRWARTRGRERLHRRRDGAGRARARAGARRGRGSGVGTVPDSRRPAGRRTYCEGVRRRAGVRALAARSPSSSPGRSSPAAATTATTPSARSARCPRAPPRRSGRRRPAGAAARAIPPQPGPGEQRGDPNVVASGLTVPTGPGRPARRQRDRRRAGHRPAAAGLPGPLARRAS